MKHPQAETPWYREPWPWILFALPVSAVIAGVVTLVIAVRNEDGLVAQDYYKEGLAINQKLEKEARASAMALSATLTLDTGQVRIDLSGNGVLPPALKLRFVHPTRAGKDRTVPLARVTGGRYQGQAPELVSGRWLVQLEDGSGTWRMSSSRWQVGEALTMGAAKAAGADRKS